MDVQKERNNIVAFTYCSIFFSCAGFVCGTFVQASNKTFPDDFIFGAGTAAYQIEGAWNVDDKGESIWDHLTHITPSLIDDQSTGDIATDSFHNYERDVEMMRELGLDYYRFSLSWPRILPTGSSNYVSEAGVAYYNNLINEMLKYNIKPIVTLYHWDIPQKLQEMGGFMNPLIADWFEDFVRVAFTQFGDRVKMWITFNEPYQVCYMGYGSTEGAPMLNATGVGEYLCGKHLLLAHARAYHIYNKEFKPQQGGVCGYTTAISASLPLNDTDEDKYAVELYKQAMWAYYTDPIYSKDGGFPKEIVEIVANKSAAQGYSRSRISDFTEEEKKYIRGTSDFFGVNQYSGLYASFSLYNASQYAIPSVDDDIGVGTQLSADWPVSTLSWLALMPDSVYVTMKHITDRYGNKWPIYVTEGGWSSDAGITDNDRVEYYRAVLKGALKAIDEGINLKGYFAWSLMDNFQWRSGYPPRFGLYEVDFEEPARTRTARKSAFVYKQIIKSRTVDPDYEPDSLVMTIDDGH